MKEAKTTSQLSPPSNDALILMAKAFSNSLLVCKRKPYNIASHTIPILILGLTTQWGNFVSKHFPIISIRVKSYAMFVEDWETYTIL